MTTRRLRAVLAARADVVRRDVATGRRGPPRARLRRAVGPEPGPRAHVDHRVRTQQPLVAPQGLRADRDGEDRRRSTRSRSLSDRPGPSYVATPYCSFTASQLALHGILAALYERERSGVGQRVETTLAQGLLAHDTWNWILKTVAARYPDAFVTAPPAEQDMLVPQLRPLLPADGGAHRRRPLAPVLADHRPAVGGVHAHGRARLDARRSRVEGRARTIPTRGCGPRSGSERSSRCVTKTLDEWNAVVRRRARRVGRDLPPRHRAAPPPAAVTYDRRVETIVDPTLARCSSPARWSGWRRRRRELDAPAPALDEHGAAIRAAASGARGRVDHRRDAAATDDPPLAGVTVVELGTLLRRAVRRHRARRPRRARHQGRAARR